MSRANTSGASVPTVPVLTPRRVNEFRTPAPISQDSKTTSPNYFGLAVHSSADVFASSAAQHIRGNWSPPSSNVRSTAAVSPRIIPVDQNPEFELFRRQSENNKGFALGNLADFSGTPSTSTPPVVSSFFDSNPAPPASYPSASASGSTRDSKGDGAPSMSKPRSPKRLLSTESSLFYDRPRRYSPASFLDGKRSDEVAQFIEDRPFCPTLPPKGSSDRANSVSNRAETLPAHLDSGSNSDGPIMVTPQHVATLLESSAEEILLLDLRVSTQFAKARISGALSLCIPTTLLKRASFNVPKLAETFKDDESRDKFEAWRSSKCIIVYDGNSSQMKDATICINTLKKFTSEGWCGGSYIIRGGFAEFSQKFPSWITHDSTPTTTSAPSGLRLDSAVAPVIGGCPLPATQNAANPFFGNIRQNMDLIGGVGQMPVKVPSAMNTQTKEELPDWLRKASNEKDNGKLVSEKFLQIEKREQKRMQEALSSNVVYGTPAPGSHTAKKVTLAGIEKGSKNRYNNIWPYEHSRVKLEDVSDGGCDYINANHIQAAWSNKRYIATQGPLPATFDDFWNVVWQQDVRVIVMLTAEQEGGQAKAHNYWKDRQYGHMHLNLLSERRASLEPSKIHRHRDRPAFGQRRSTNPPTPASLAREASSSAATQPPGSEQPYVIVRNFTLSNSDAPFERMREITQLQYSHWPDFGAPAHPAHLLGLIEQCDAVVRQVNGGSASQPDPPNGRPVLVHCSAGCGRTGTFCTVDSVIDMLKRQRQARNTARRGSSVDADVLSNNPFFKDPNPVEGSWVDKDDNDLIEKTVEDFRLQRLSMVQSLRQFVLCYESILEWLAEQHPRSA
ncbi:tyrosine-protein phosphatase non-receptor type 6 [Delitschia confertaspora ATCC 74209]|uniref:protein-tyrosine-phosphatase n=1 Tax=Delitschia confertaspora ATCC 74209 TaxID=1513339 RepID=A0A9P4JS88_9PLEO|nr:tyrosine-protein phosphatase non-receptor type 6 [Delitschia confertaspora ATCC 74209]